MAYRFGASRSTSSNQFSTTTSFGRSEVFRPIGMNAELRTVNVRNETIVSALPSMFTGASGRVVFPDYADSSERHGALLVEPR